MVNHLNLNDYDQSSIGLNPNLKWSIAKYNWKKLMDV